MVMRILKGGIFMNAEAESTNREAKKEMGIKRLLKSLKKYMMENLDIIAPGIIMMNGGYYRPNDK